MGECSLLEVFGNEQFSFNLSVDGLRYFVTHGVLLLDEEKALVRLREIPDVENSECVEQVLEPVAEMGVLVGGVQQAVRRVIDGEKVPAKAKVLSLFEPQTQIVVRHKPGKPVEFGRKLWLDEVEGGIISRYVLLPEVGPDHPYLPASVAAHKRRFGHPPRLLAGDRGMIEECPARSHREVRAKLGPIHASIVAARNRGYNRKLTVPTSANE